MALQTAMPTKSLSTTPFKTDPLVDDDIQEEIEDFELHLSDDDPDALKSSSKEDEDELLNRFSSPGLKVKEDDCKENMSKSHVNSNIFLKKTDISDCEPKAEEKLNLENDSDELLNVEEGDEIATKNSKIAKHKKLKQMNLKKSKTSCDKGLNSSSAENDLDGSLDGNETTEEIENKNRLENDVKESEEVRNEKPDDSKVPEVSINNRNDNKINSKELSSNEKTKNKKGNEILECNLEENEENTLKEPENISIEEDSCDSNKNTIREKNCISEDSDKSNGDSNKLNDDSGDKDQENEELLQIMDVQPADEVEAEVEIDKIESNENSCSSSEKDDIEVDSPKNENLESMESDDYDKNDNLNEVPMELEELNVGKVIEGRLSNEKPEECDQITEDNDATLVNEDDESSVGENVEAKDEQIPDINKDDPDDKEVDNKINQKQLKRQLSDDNSSDSTGSSKKLKLSSGEQPKSKPEVYKLTKLTSLSEFLIAKDLKNITRMQLEELCLQKICEAIASKSEIADLRHQLQTQEQIVDACKKECSQVAKQARDLQIVQNKLLQELKVRRNTDKPIIPVKITRSVGLQAYIEEKKKMVKPNGSPSAALMNLQTQKGNTAITRSPITKHTPRIINKTAATKTTTSSAQKVQINNGNVVNIRSLNFNQTLPIGATKTAAKGVIDLTDEDEKAVPKKSQFNSRPVLNSNSPKTSSSPQQVKLNNFNKVGVTVPGQKLLVVPTIMSSKSGSSPTVMFKVNSGQTNGIMSSNSQALSLLSQQQILRTNQKQVTAGITIRNIAPSLPTKSVDTHPAPLPPPPNVQYRKGINKPIPPKPHLTLTKTSDGTGILLQWKMPYNLSNFEGIASYQLFAYQETNSPPKTENWGKIGDVKALALPMAVTLTQFATGNRYYFAVRAVDVHERLGIFSEPQTILL